MQKVVDVHCKRVRYCETSSCCGVDHEVPSRNLAMALLLLSIVTQNVGDTHETASIPRESKGTGVLH